nr:hypothetical protein [Tanacetum cinerariifolium]
MFEQDKDANGNRMFTPVSAVGSTYVNLGGSICVNAATFPHADLLTDPLMSDLEDTADLQDTRILVVHMMMKLRIHIPNKVYKVEKALYGLHQASKAWYETLSTYLLENRFRRAIIDKTLFIKKDKGDLLLVQVYVDDIIFGSTKKSLCTESEGLMHKKFQMSYMVKTASTPIETNKALFKDEEANDVDVHLYRSMIGSLMYLTSSRPDIIFVVCVCARFQVTTKVSHLYAMKRIFRYLKCQPKLGLWYPRDSPFDLEAF